MQLSEWARDVLLSRGALVETEEDSRLRALLPAEISEKLGVGDWLSLDFSGRPGADDSSEWLDRLGALLPASLRVAGGRLRQPPIAGRIDTDAVLNRELVIQNGVWRSVDDYAETAPYYWFSFQYAVESDEQSIGQITTCLNGLSRSWTGQPASLFRAVRDNLEEDPGFTVPFDQLRVLYPAAEHTAQAEVKARVAFMEQSANRRLARDYERMDSYYGAMLAQLRKRAARRAADPDGAAKDLSRIEATELDRAAKLEDLLRKYSLRVRLALADVLVVAMPVRAVVVRLIRKKEDRQVVLHWNSVLRALDTPLCESCRGPARPLFLCEKVHLLCNDCWGPCPRCSRPFCRACRPQCKCTAPV